MAEVVGEVVGDGAAGALTVVRLLQNPLGAEASPGERGDMVRISDGEAHVYLLASEFDMASPTTLRWLLAQQRSSAPPDGGAGSPAPQPSGRPAP